MCVSVYIQEKLCIVYYVDKFEYTIEMGACAVFVRKYFIMVWYIPYHGMVFVRKYLPYHGILQYN